jgi:hydrogenase nickel incorporation protein HypB
MISKELGESVKVDTNLLIIENVGNLVCPAAFDLGEDIKVALLSTTEGEDKPSKYPVLFHTASVVVITKTDLIPHLEWDLDKCIAHIRKVNGTAPIILLSAKTGEGMNAWINTLNTLLG